MQKPEQERDNTDIYVFDRETGLTHQIITNISRDDLPKWSENGKQLYFRSSRGLQWNIWRVNIAL